jgi:hypothetical protein
MIQMPDAPQEFAPGLDKGYCQRYHNSKAFDSKRRRRRVDERQEIVPAVIADGT